jgi:hypothetical protein
MASIGLSARFPFGYVLGVMEGDGTYKKYPKTWIEPIIMEIEYMLYRRKFRSQTSDNMDR